MRLFTVHIAILQLLETASRRVTFLAQNVETAIHFASIDLAEGEYVNEVTIELQGETCVAWDYIHGSYIGCFYADSEEG